jgi:hypothetical protein
MNTPYYGDNLKVLRTFIILILFSLLLSGCGGNDPWYYVPDVEPSVEATASPMPTDTATPEPTPTPNVPIPIDAELYIPQNPCDSAYSPLRPGVSWTTLFTYSDDAPYTQSNTIMSLTCDEQTSLMVVQHDGQTTSGQITTKCDRNTHFCSSTYERLNSGETSPTSSTYEQFGESIDFTEGFVIGQTYHYLKNWSFSLNCVIDEEVIGWEEVQTSLGSFQTILVTSSLTCSSDAVQQSPCVEQFWYAYGIGMVKFTRNCDNGGSHVSELTGYSIP